jgi:hypothetical protein
LKRLKWERADLQAGAKTSQPKIELAARLRQETTLTIRQMARRWNIGSWKSLNNRLYLAAKTNRK